MPLTVLITGASAGIGAATARAFASGGHRVLLAARSADALSDLARGLNDEHGEGTALALPLDVADADAHERAISGLPADWREIDVAVLNAGLAKSMVPVWENTAAETDQMVDVNVKGVLNGIRALVPGMLERARGHVVLDRLHRRPLRLPRRDDLLRHEARRPRDRPRPQAGPPRDAAPRLPRLARPRRDRLLARPLQRRRRPRRRGLLRHRRAGARGRRRGRRVGDGAARARQRAGGPRHAARASRWRRHRERRRGGCRPRPLAGGYNGRAPPSERWRGAVPEGGVSGAGARLSCWPSPAGGKRGRAEGGAPPAPRVARQSWRGRLVDERRRL